MRRRTLLSVLGTSGFGSGCIELQRHSESGPPPRTINVQRISGPELGTGSEKHLKGEVSVTDPVIDSESTATIELSISNQSTDPVYIKRYNEGYMLGLYDSIENGPVMILDNDGPSNSSVDPDCWRLRESFPPDGVYQMQLEGRETVRSTRHVYGAPENSAACLSRKKYRFKRKSPSWSFDIEVIEK